MNLRKNDSATNTANAGKSNDPYVPEGHGRTDEQIRADVHELLTQKEAQSVDGLSLSVRDGIVTLEGDVQSQADRQRVCDLIRAIPSVKRVEDELRASSGGRAS